MKAPNAKIMLVAVSALAIGGTPAAAQVSDSIVLNIMRECAKIDDVSARLACYDNNIANAGSAPVLAPTISRSLRPPSGDSGPFGETAGNSGFGADSIRSTARFAPPSANEAAIEAEVTAARLRQPGIYIVTLADGAEWTFAETVSNAYKTPTAGSNVTISRGAMGGYLMRYDNQAQVRVRRTK
jgi:hypothetical protein